MFLSVFGLLASAACAQHVVDLSGDKWTVTNDALNISVPGKLPSQAHLDLYADQVIGDPYYGLNNYNLRWVAWSNWTYVSDPIAGLSSNNGSTSWLVFYGLDTFTSIELCGQHIASTNNQFRQYYFDVSSVLRGCSESKPVLSINFGSAPTIADSIAAQPGQETWPGGVEQVYQFPNRQFIRKEQSDFGWDWGPAFAPAGPWQPAHVVQLAPSELYSRNALVDIYRQGQLNNLIPDQSKDWVVNASIDYLGSLPKGAGMSFVLKDSNNSVIKSGALSSVNATNGAISGMTTVPSSAVDLWWPTDMGPQTLYNMTISITDGGSKPILSVERRVGFRTIINNGGPITAAQLAQGIAPGNNWHFEINGHEFFAKGSNFIPPDAFWPRVTEAKIQQLFDSVIEGRQNMLRVWSSGAYAPDYLYDIADEMGILLWSEFQFSDALYPVNAEFLDNVVSEVDYQVRRVNHHPSLALWAGGNELENLELVLVNGSAPNEYQKYQDEYEKLFLDTIVPLVFGNTRSISYQPSSAGNGYISINHTQAPYYMERYSNVASGSIYGENENYNYIASEAFDAAYYPAGRFTAEFGFHSMPSLQTWQQAVSARDLHFNSTVIVMRNQHYPPGGLNVSDQALSLKGMAEMTEAVELWYPTPSKADGVGNFSAWCHATQVFQADFYRAQLEWYRRGSGLPQRTLGTLYWQLEDIWQGPTWAGIEYDGRWKMLHYAARDIYKHVIVSPIWNISTDEFGIWATSDLWEAAEGTVSASWYDWAGNALNLTGLRDERVQVGAINSTQVLNARLLDVIKGQDANDVVMRATVNVTGTLPNSKTPQTFVHENWFHPGPLATAKLADPGLTLQYDAARRTFTVEATTAVATHVWLDYPPGAVVVFDDNAFWLAKGEKRSVGFTVKSGSIDDSWPRAVTVQSLWNQTLHD